MKAFEKVCIDNQDINLKLFFIGPYEEEIKISDFLKTNINKVIDIGSVDNHLQFISITNVLCLPSYREGFGSIIIDAAAMKVPSLGYDIPGLQIQFIITKQASYQRGVIFTLFPRICTACMLITNLETK